MNDSDARRLVDFAAGLAFAKRGSIDKVTTKVFMLLPSDIDPADFSPEQRREYAGAYSR
jgi:cell division inhibitor SepF